MGFNMYVPTRFVFGNGRLNELHQQKLPGKKAMLAISNGKSVRENGALARTEEQLKLADVETALPLCLRRRNNPVVAAMAGIRHEHGRRHGV